MATKPLVHVDGVYGKWARYKWEGLANGDDGEPLRLESLAADVAIQAIGDFGGGTLSMTGANDDAPTFTALTDPQGSEIALTAAGHTSLGDQPLETRPELAGGADGSVAVWALVRYVTG